MKRDVHRYLRLPYTKRAVPDQGTNGERLYFASVDELPGCNSHGSTPEEALLNLEDAMQLYIESMLEDGLEPPEPSTARASETRSAAA